jgi:predicted RNase H-like HicB family nuclease
MAGQRRHFTAVIDHEGAWYVARCVEVELASQGRTPAEAVDALREALELRFEGEELPELPQVERFEVAV